MPGREPALWRLTRDVTGSQIRWASVGRVAAIVAAAIAGIASLPALLGGDAPPPVPPDIGLAPLPIAAAPIPGADASPPAPAAKPTKRRHRHRHERRPTHRSAGHRSAGHARRQRGHREHAAHGETSEAPSAIYGPAPLYVPPPSPGEFRIER
jgi:hypothetical protein